MTQREHKGYYSIASGRWVSHAEVVEAENTIEALTLEQRARKLRREAYEAKAEEAAASGDFNRAREILEEGRKAEASSIA